VKEGPPAFESLHQCCLTHPSIMETKSVFAATSAESNVTEQNTYSDGLQNHNYSSLSTKFFRAIDLYINGYMP